MKTEARLITTTRVTTLAKTLLSLKLFLNVVISVTNAVIVPGILWRKHFPARCGSCSCLCSNSVAKLVVWSS